MTSWHDVTKPDFPISACRCARKLILFLFPWFFRSLSSKMLLIFHFCDTVTSWRHVMTSLNLIFLSQLVDVLESWFFFCFHGFLGHWVQICYYFSIFVMPWRHRVMSWRHKTWFTYISVCWRARKLILILFPWFFRSLSSKMLSIFHFCDAVTSWRNVMTSL